MADHTTNFYYSYKTDNVVNKPILIVDNDAEDVHTFKKAFRKAGYWKKIVSFKNGIELLEYLLAMTSVEYPSLILLDLNMPLVDGWKVLREIKRYKYLNGIPIIIFTTSTSEKDKPSRFYIHRLWRWSKHLF